MLIMYIRSISDKINKVLQHFFQRQLNPINVSILILKIDLKNKNNSYTHKPHGMLISIDL
jgi:20S proteasome alpha/beta subunit